MDFEKFLAELKAARAALQEKWEANVEPSFTENRLMNDEEQTRHTEIEGKLKSKDVEIAKIEKIVANRRACPNKFLLRKAFCGKNWE